VTDAFPLRRYATINSTNLEAQRLAAAGTRGPLLLVAEEQGAGKGRLGRNWISARGNLYTSLLLPTGAAPAMLPQLAFVTALAVHDAVSGFCGTEDVRLKWPNDCLLAGAKVAGILCETAAGGQAVIGCGINVEHSPEGLAYPTAHLRQFAPEAHVEGVLRAYATALKGRLAAWREGAGFAGILADWQARAHGLHMPLRVSAGGRAMTGIFSGLAPDGALVVKLADGTMETIYAGDVTFMVKAE
jgi:BirA family biotin operon repressor/biotin-[acetyl-CoA-carboxylase] ligase